LAIGANGAIFGVVERVLLNPLPYPASDRLIGLDHGQLALNLPSDIGLTPGLFLHYVNGARTLESAALYSTSDMTIADAAGPERVRVTRATPSLAAVLRVSPLLGRWFTADEGVPGAGAVVVLSHGLWTRRYGRDPHVIGRSLAIGNTSAEVVGVMPASFAFPDPQDELWLAMVVDPAEGFGFWGTLGVARLREGVSLEAARADLQSLIATVGQAYPGDVRARGNVDAKLIFAGETLKDATLGNVSRGLWILLSSVGVVLLVACANVANLFLVRSEGRQREVAIRQALGAGRAGMTRYFLAESLLLAASGGAVGSLLSLGALRALVRLSPTTLPRLHEIHWNWHVLVYIVLWSALAAAVCGSIPLWRGDAASTRALHDTGRGNTATRRRQYTRHALLGAQVALALVLLIASGLMVHSFRALRAIDPGFDGSSALTFGVGLSDHEYPTRDAMVAAHQEIRERLSTLPGVTAVAATTCLPLHRGCFGNTLRVEGRTYSEENLPAIANFRAVTDRYFETMGTRLLRGRTFTRDDVDRKEPVVVITDALAKRHFPGEDPIGRRVATNQPPVAGRRAPFAWLTIVGIVADTPVHTLPDAQPIPQLYMPLSLARGPEETPEQRLVPGVSTLNYVVRTVTPPLDLVPAARRAIQGFDANLAIARPRSLQDVLDRASAQMAFTMVLLAIAAAVALLLGVIGIYGVMSYIVSQRTAEIGVRLALGANPAGVAGQIVRQGSVVALVGIGAGLGVAFTGAQLMTAILYGVSARDPLVFASMAAMLLLVALLACWVPARRAARLSPLAALRAE
jgi:predicted permease